jgi:hypothetical protein
MLASCATASQVALARSAGHRAKLSHAPWPSTAASTASAAAHHHPDDHEHHDERDTDAASATVEAMKKHASPIVPKSAPGRSSANRIST